MGQRRYISVIILLVVLMLLYRPIIGQACDCAIPPNATEAMTEATTVFRGEVIKIKSEKQGGTKYDVALLSVSEIWKGIKESQVIIYTEWSSCQFHFVIGEEYLLYVYEHNNKLKVINCGRSKKVKYSEKDLLELGRGMEPSHYVHLKAGFQYNKIAWLISLGVVLLITVTIGIFYLERKIKKS